MRIHGKCSRCARGISIFTLYPTRVDLARDKGEYIAIECRFCKNSEKYHLNDLKAFSSPYFGLIYGIAILVDVLLFLPIFDTFNLSNSYKAGLIFISAATTVAVCALAFKRNRQKVSHFNRVFLKQKK